MEIIDDFHQTHRMASMTEEVEISDREAHLILPERKVHVLDAGDVCTDKCENRTYYQDNA